MPTHRQRTGTGVSSQTASCKHDSPAQTAFRFEDYLLHELLDHYPLGARGINPDKKPGFELAAYDQANGTQKTRFLYTYMACNGSTGKTAERMGIHRNSVG